MAFKFLKYICIPLTNWKQISFQVTEKKNERKCSILESPQININHLIAFVRLSANLEKKKNKNKKFGMRHMFYDVLPFVHSE